MPRPTICCRRAVYFDIKVGDRVVKDVAWSYPEPTPAFSPIRDHIAIYPHEMDACLIDGERAEPQPGSFYGGWVTSDLVGPFKGAPGSSFW